MSEICNTFGIVKISDFADGPEVVLPFQKPFFHCLMIDQIVLDRGKMKTWIEYEGHAEATLQNGGLNIEQVLDDIDVHACLPS